MNLPPKAERLLRWIVAYHKRRGYMPTIREMTTALRMKSTSHPRYYLGLLEDAGLIVRANGRARTMRVKGD